MGDSYAMFTNRHGEPANPESISQLFERKIERAGLPPIRFHDLRHTHASLLLADGTAIKVVSERLGHANPAFTMATYQHLIPGMAEKACIDFHDAVYRPTAPPAQTCTGRHLPTRNHITPGHGHRRHRRW